MASLTEANPSAATGVTMTWLMEDAIEPDAGLSMAKMTVDAGVLSEAHHHTNRTEAIHLLSGAVRQRSGDEWIEMKAGDTVLIPVGAVHQTQNMGEQRAVLMIAYSSGSRIYIS